jgi:cytochrome c-type biogenesis protein CcmF
MHLAHIGVAVFIVGVTVVKNTEIEQDTRIAIGETVNVADYSFRFTGMRDLPGPNYSSLEGRFEVAHNGQPIAVLLPEKRTYAASGQTMTDAAIDNGWFRHLYVSLGEPINDDPAHPAWGVRIYIKPFVAWIWAGCFLMAAGGLLALCDRRYRIVSKSSSRVQRAAPGAASVSVGGVAPAIAIAKASP